MAFLSSVLILYFVILLLIYQFFSSVQLTICFILNYFPQASPTLLLRFFGGEIRVRGALPFPVRPVCEKWWNCMDVEKSGIRIVCFLYSQGATRALGHPPQRVFHNNAESLIKPLSSYSELSLCHVVGQLCRRFRTMKKKKLLQALQLKFQNVFSSLSDLFFIAFFPQYTFTLTDTTSR